MVDGLHALGAASERFGVDSPGPDPPIHTHRAGQAGGSEVLRPLDRQGVVLVQCPGPERAHARSNVQSVLQCIPAVNGNGHALCVKEIRRRFPRQHDAHRLSHAWIFFDNDTCVLIVVVPGSGIGKKIIQDRNAIVAGLPELGTECEGGEPSQRVRTS